MPADVLQQVITRAKLSAPYRVNAAYGGPLAGAYAHARNAAPQGTVLDKPDDVRAEADRIGAMYARLRRFVDVMLDAGPTRYRPGQIIRIEYPRYDLDDVNGFVVAVAPDEVNRTVKLTLWI